MSRSPSHPATPSFVGASARIFDLSVGEMLWSRRTIFMALVVAGPVLIALVSRAVEAGGTVPLRINGLRVDGAGIGCIASSLKLMATHPAPTCHGGDKASASRTSDKRNFCLFGGHTPSLLNATAVKPSPLNRDKRGVFYTTFPLYPPTEKKKRRHDEQQQYSDHYVEQPVLKAPPNRGRSISRPV